MKKVFLNVSNHILTPDQLSEVNKLGMEVMELPDNVKQAWSNVTPSNINRVIDLVIDSTNIILSTDESLGCTSDEDYFIEGVLVAGHPGAVYQLCSKLMADGIKCFYAHTERQSIEREVNGEVIKTSVFKHKGFFSMSNNTPMESMWK